MYVEKRDIFTFFAKNTEVKVYFLPDKWQPFTEEIPDKVYKRLKISDNVSRYRQGIFIWAADYVVPDIRLRKGIGNTLQNVIKAKTFLLQILQKML